MPIKIYPRVALLLICIFCFSRINAQISFKEYIDSYNHCNEFCNQVFVDSSSIILLNYSTCDLQPDFTSVYKLSSIGEVKKELIIQELVTNINSGYISSNELFIAGTNNGEAPESRFVIWAGDNTLDSVDLVSIELSDSLEELALVPIGTIKVDSSKVIYGQCRKKNDLKVISYLLWLNKDLSKDSVIFFDTTYDWSIISDATIDENNNLVILIETINLVGNVEYHSRIIQKYNPSKEKYFEWSSQPFFGDQGLGSLTTISPETVIVEFVSEEDEYVHSIIAVSREGDIVWKWHFALDDAYSSFRINDIITSQDGNIVCCGTYRNISEDILFTGLLFKLDKIGNLLWQRIFLDEEELLLSGLGATKVIIFQTLAEGTYGELIIGGRAIHDYLLVENNSDIFFAIVDSSGCITKDCSQLQFITRIDDFLSTHKTWTEGVESNDAAWSFRYKFDTIPIELDGNIYYELLRSYSEFSEDWTPAGSLLRYEFGHVFLYGAGSENIIYDFTLIEGDTFHMGSEIAPYDLIVEQIDTVTLLNGDLKKKWTLQPVNPIDPLNDNTIVWIEEIGNLNGLMANFLPWTFDADNTEILCVSWLNNLLYDNPEVDSCWILSTSTQEGRNEDLILVPNPAIQTISIVGEQKIENVIIYDYLGNLKFQGSEKDISLIEFPVGYYFVVVFFATSEIRTAGFIKI